MRWSVGVVCGLAMMMARPVVAQQAADSMAFRSGQWGAEFTAGSEARSLGVLRFLSPRRALVLDGSGAFESASGDTAAESYQRELQVRLGMRFFRTVTPRVRQYVTVGALAGLQRLKQQWPTFITPPVAERTTNRNFAGVFSNVGGMWQANAHLALGANMEASYTYGSIRERETSPTSDRRATTHRVAIGAPRFVVSVLF